jgi:orotate phosphoribosyltransferase
MVKILAKVIVDLKIPFFGENLKNKHDSCSCMFDVRKLLSSPVIMKYVGQRMAKIALNKCKSKVLMGIATSGIPWTTLTSIYSNYPMMYIRKNLERHMSNKIIEGIVPKNKQIILIDDLLFAGESKSQSIELLREHGYSVTDIIVVVDRQLQRKSDGLSLQKKYGIQLYSLITMDEIIQYMIKIKTITNIELFRLIADYRKFERWDMPKFAAF